MTTTRLALEKLVAGVTTRANLISYWNSNADILDTLIKGTGLSGGQTIYGGTGASESLALYGTAHATKGQVLIPAIATTDAGTPSLQLRLSRSATQITGLVFSGAVTADVAIFCSPSDDKLYIGSWGGSGAFNKRFSFDAWSGDLWVYNDCSALTFTDRTEAFLENALSAIENIKSDANGALDHTTLPEFAVSPYRDEKGEWWAGRSLGAMISILVKATQERSAQYAAAIADRDKKIAALDARIAALEKLAPAKG